MATAPPRPEAPPDREATPTAPLSAREFSAAWRLTEITLAYPALYLILSFALGGVHRRSP